MNEDLSSLAIVDGLMHASMEALQDHRALEAAVITLETTEDLLRMLIRSLGLARGLGEDTLSMATDPQDGFRQLVLHAELLSPDNARSHRLLDLHREHSTITQRLFLGSGTYEACHDRLRALCLKGLRLNRELRAILTAAPGSPPDAGSNV